MNASDPDTRLISNTFPRSSAYNPEWAIANGMGSNALWMTEWLTSVIDLKPGMLVLDLGCGRAVSSIFMAREFDVQVWATDLWICASENIQRINDAGLSDRVFPLHCDAKALPFAGDFFDAITIVDSFSYYGTDDLYLNYLANFVKPGGQIGIAGAGLIAEFDSPPEHLAEMWTQDFWGIHSADWWKHHWGRTKIVDVEVAETMQDGWHHWVDWHETAHPENQDEIAGVKADAGRNLGYIRVVGRKNDDVELQDYCWPDNLRSFPAAYTKFPLLR